jgi:hypothetical protein
MANLRLHGGVRPQVTTVYAIIGNRAFAMVLVWLNKSVTSRAATNGRLNLNEKAAKVGQKTS